MPKPSKPTLDYSYAAFQQAQGSNNFPGSQLDNDLANLKQAIDATIDFAGNVIRSDGKLQNGSVTKSSLDESIRLGLPAPRPWATATAYALNETATINNSLYIALAAHTAGVFATDLAAGRWALLIEFTVPASVADNAITTPKLADNAVTKAKMADSAVGTAELEDQGVTLAKLASAVQAALAHPGQVLDFIGARPPSGWQFCFGQAVSRVTYGALFAAICPAFIGNVMSGSNTITGLTEDLRGLGLEGVPLEGAGLAAGATIASVTQTTIVMSLNATGSASSTQCRAFPHGAGDGATTFALPDLRGRVTAGRDNMGGAAANALSAAGAGASVDGLKLGAAGGADRHTLTTAQLASHNHTAISSVTDPGHFHNGVADVTTNTLTGAAPSNTFATAGSTDSAFTGISVATTVNPNGGGEAHPNVQPTRVLNKIIYMGAG